jgi:hypothetical protein
MFNSPLTPTASVDECVEERIAEVVEKFTVRLDAQDQEIRKLRAEIASMKPRVVYRRHDIDSLSLELV